MNGKDKLLERPVTGFQEAPILMRWEDRLFVRHAGNFGAMTLTLRGRFMGNDGNVRPFHLDMTPSTTNAFQTSYFNPGEGWLLSAVVTTNNTAVRRGHVYAQLGIMRGTDTPAGAVQILAADYVEQIYGLTWPGGVIRSSIEGPGLINSRTGTNPAAGAEISETVPTNSLWRPIAIFAQLVTDATVATRLPRLVFNDGSNDFLLSPVSGTQTASQLVYHNWYPMTPHAITTGGVRSGPFPQDCLLPGGYSISTNTSLLAAGDDWDAPQILVEEWIME